MAGLMEKTAILAGLLALGVLLAPLAVFAHPVPETSYAVRVENEKFSENTVKTGDIITITGELKNLHDEPFEVHMAIIVVDGDSGEDQIQPGFAYFYVEPTDDPAKPGEFILPAGSTMPYSIALIAIRPGTFHVHTAVMVIPQGATSGEDYAYGKGQTLNAVGDEISQDTAKKLTDQYLESLGPKVGYYEQTVTVDDAQIGIGISSHATVSGFIFSQEKKSVSFSLNGQGSDRGITTIEVGKVLDGPYTVMLDGRSFDDYEVVSAGGADFQSIRIYHDNTSSHNVTITGTQVVPEFPLPALFTALAAIGVVVLAGRTRLIK